MHRKNSSHGGPRRRRLPHRNLPTPFLARPAAAKYPDTKKKFGTTTGLSRDRLAHSAGAQKLGVVMAELLAPPGPLKPM